MGRISLTLIKLKDLLQNNDIVLAIGIVTIILMMVIPIPAQLLDLLLTLNISLSVLILLVCLYTKEPLEYSSFPTILLVSTLFRLGLNVTSTRLILLEADAGSVIEAFGQFVVGGNYVVSWKGFNYNKVRWHEVGGHKLAFKSVDRYGIYAWYVLFGGA